MTLAASEKDTLMQICSHVAYRDTVLEQWGMRKYYAYGDCVSALFKGAPGTGKTMAAHVVANELHMALYQVDLSSVLDKYIGETEKRLEEIFLSLLHQMEILEKRFLDLKVEDPFFNRTTEVMDLV